LSANKDPLFSFWCFCQQTKTHFFHFGAFVSKQKPAFFTLLLAVFGDDGYSIREVHSFFGGKFARHSLTKWA